MVVFYPCCGDYGDYLRGFFSILSYPQVFVSIRETGLFCSGLGSFSKLGYRAVTSHLLMPSGTTNKSCYSENCSVFEGFYALFVQGGVGIILRLGTPSQRTEAFARIALPCLYLLRGFEMRRVGILSWRSTRMSVLSVAAGALATVASLATPSHAGVVTFGGSGTGQSFQMEFVPIGNPGNAHDTTGAPNPGGSVGRTYDINTFEVSRAMVTAYNANPGVVGISLEDMTINGGNGANRPATGITWNEAARFVNWLNTQKGFAPAYNYANSTITTNLTPWTEADTLDYDASNPYRSKRANFFLPSSNEWYKAAYYDPNKTTGSNKYWDYATGSDSAPTITGGGTAVGSAVYGRTAAQGPADVKNAGGLSPYGVMGLGGNVFEWEETSFLLYNGSGSNSRGFRGGSWIQGFSDLSSSSRRSLAPTSEDNEIGFRVASYNSDAVVPEPSMMVIGTLFGLGGLVAKRRRKK
jgi:formylglycine-generating enzyme required for sulfatase activity